MKEEGNEFNVHVIELMRGESKLCKIFIRKAACEERKMWEEMQHVWRRAVVKRNIADCFVRFKKN